MRLYRSIKLTRSSLHANRLRTLLALLGISIGVAAVIIMVAIGRGAQHQLLKQVESMGTNLLTVKAGQVTKVIGRERQYGDVTTLTQRDLESILRECPSVEDAAPVQDGDIRVKYGNMSFMAKVLGTTPNFKTIRNYTVARGRFFTPDENRAGMRVAVIGSDVRKRLFKDSDPIGEIIRIGKVPFEVIGLLESIGASTEGGNEDVQILVPMRTAMRRVFNLRHLKLIYIRVRRQELMGRAEQEVRQLLRERHRLDRRQKNDDFTIRNQVTVMEMKRQSTDSFTLLIAGIAGIALLVGGIGILAIMLLAVRERTNEIGLRRAVGARKRDILTQFLLEALLLGFSGGLLGVVLGISGAWLVSLLTSMVTVIPLPAIVISVLFSLSVGLFFGVYPARKASLMDPIDALKAD